MGCSSSCKILSESNVPYELKMTSTNLKYNINNLNPINCERAKELFKNHKLENTNLLQGSYVFSSHNKIENSKNYIEALETLKKTEEESKSQYSKNYIKRDLNLYKNKINYNTLDNKFIDKINFCVEKITEYYEQQTPPKNRTTYFKDDLFPPNNDSIFGIRKGNFFDPDENRREKAKSCFNINSEDIIWLRAKDIFINGRYSIFSNDIYIDDVMQGFIGNCYFLSSLAAMTELPQLILQLFKSLTVPENGCFEIAVRLQGQWKIVLVNDYFPCHFKTRKPLFAKPRDCEIWVMILEKVWAKINGGYINTIGGSSSDVLNSFTSFPMSTLHHHKFLKSLNEKSLDILWDHINNSELEGYIMTCDSKEISEEDSSSTGIIPGHAFTISTTREGYINTTRVRLLNIRNPWGYKEWNGAWSDKSPEWTEEAFKIFNVEKDVKEDGRFWISYEDFLKYFSTTHICKVYSPQCSKSILISREKSDLPQIFELHIIQTNKVTVSAIKKTWRIHRKLPSTAELQVNIIIAKKINDRELEYVTSLHENEHDPLIECTLTEGIYQVFVHANYKFSNFDHIRNYTVYFTSNKYFNVVYRGVDNDNLDLLRNIIISRVENNLSKSPKEFIKTENKFELTTYGYLYLRNNSEDVYQVAFKNECQNFQLLGNYTENENIDILLNPHEKIVILGIRKKYYDKFKFNLQIIESKKVESCEVDLIKKPYIIDSVSMYLINELIQKINETDYDFIYKKIDFDTDHICEKINFIELSNNYFSLKYLELNELKEKIQPIQDDIQVIFRDFFDIDQYSCYLGEWRLNPDFIRHGRGIWIWSDGSFYMGQFVNDHIHGFGIFYYPNGDRIEITWFEGSMHGKGLYFKSDGDSNEIYYENGKVLDQF
jgi:calpain-15